MSSFDRLLPHPLGVATGSRLHLSCDNLSNPDFINLIDEDVLPEQVANPEARHVKWIGHVELTPKSAKWLRDALAELCAEFDRLGIVE